MSSLEEFESSCAANENDPSSSMTCREYSVAPSADLDNRLINDSLLHPAETDLSSFDCDNFSRDLDEYFSEFNPTPAYIPDGELPHSIERATATSEDSSNNSERPCVGIAESGSAVTEISDALAHLNFISDTQCVETHSPLRLRNGPYPNQRARYEKELNEEPRFVSTPNDDGILLEIPDLRTHLLPNTSVMVRVSRTTIPRESDGIICCHPYPLYTTNVQAIAHQGSILFPVTQKNMAEQLIKIDHLIMGRLRQRDLKTIQQWPISTPEQLNCDGYHSINTDKPKRIIENYNLRYSILRFQLFLVDENHAASQTDFLCETGSIYEYENKELASIPPAFRSKGKSRIKRLQHKATATGLEQTKKPLKQRRYKLHDLIHTKSTEQ